MRKAVLFFAVLLMAVPVMAEPTVTITCTQVPDSNEMVVSYSVVPPNSIPVRAFGLDIQITTGDADITKVTVSDANFRIFPGQITIVDGSVTDYGTCYDGADLGDANVTVEMGTLYADTDPNFQDPPGPSGELFRFWVDCNLDSNYSITENILRGGVVMEDPDVNAIVVESSGTIVCGQPCTVPDILNMTGPDANAAIIAANLVPGTPTTSECNDTVADGLVISQSPSAGVQVVCGTEVDKVLSLNPPLADAASNPTPSDGAVCVAPNPTLSWTVGAGTVTQDIYFGTTTPPPLVAADVNASTNTYATVTAVYTRYYWRIDSKNECDEVTTGTEWCFSTGPNAGRPCCQTDPNYNCLGDVDLSTWVRSTDVPALFAFVQALGAPYRCQTAVGSTTCPPCFDVNGDGWVRSTDVTALFALIQSWGPPYRKQCQWLPCPLPVD